MVERGAHVGAGPVVTGWGGRRLRPAVAALREDGVASIYWDHDGEEDTLRPAGWAADSVWPMTQSEFLDRLVRIKTGSWQGVRAPHKPLLLLLALGRVAQGRRRLVAFASIELELRRLLAEFGPPRNARHAVYPFGRLRNDGLWEIPGDDALATTSSGNLYAKELREQGIVGGFPKEVYRLLAANPSLVVAAAEQLLARYFPSSHHDDIRVAAGLRWDWSVTQRYPERPDSAAFRIQVLEEYERRCSICGFDVSLDDRTLGLDAVRLKWSSHGGPNDVSNALAACLLHQRALNRGALGIQPDRSGYRVLVSGKVAGSSAATARLLDLHGRPVSRPRTPALAPSASFVDWHRKWVFQTPPRLEATA